MKENQLLSLIFQQTEYIDQIEKENLFIKYEMEKFQMNLKNVISENEILYKESQAFITRATILESDRASKKTTSLLKEDEAKNLAKIHANDNFNQWQTELTNVKTMYLAEISKLKSELNLTKSELKMVNKQFVELKETNSKESFNEESSKINKQNEVDVKNTKNMVDAVIKERNDLLETINGLNETIENNKKQETILRNEIQQSLAKLEEMQLENSHLIFQNKNLTENLEIISSRFDNSLIDNQKMLQQAFQHQKQELMNEINDLKEKNSVSELSCLKYQLALDKSETQISRLNVTLQETKEEVINNEKNMALMNAENQAELQNMIRRYEAIESNLRDSRKKLEHDIQIEKQEKVQHQEKVIKLSRRLEVSQNEALRLQNLNISLIEEVNNLDLKVKEKSIQLTKVEESYSKEYLEIAQKLKHTIREQSDKMDIMDIQYKQRLKDLESLTCKQAELINKLKSECFTLEEELTNISDKYENDIKILTMNNSELILKTKNLVEKNQDLMDQCVKHGLMHRTMKQHMSELNMKVHNNHMLEVIDKEVFEK